MADDAERAEALVGELWRRILGDGEDAATVLADLARRDAERAAAFEAELTRAQAELDAATAEVLRLEGRLQ